MQKITFVQKKGQITLPVSIREMFNLVPGSAVKVSVQDKAIMVEPAQVITKEESNEFLEVLDELAVKNNTTREKLLEDWNRTRQESFRKAHPKLWLRWQQKQKNGSQY